MLFSYPIEDFASLPEIFDFLFLFRLSPEKR